MGYVMCVCVFKCECILSLCVCNRSGMLGGKKYVREPVRSPSMPVVGVK